MSKKCKKCNQKIPNGRLKILPNTTVCVNCSTVEKVGCVDITYHKTGNTIQVLPKEQAQKINKASARLGFGILSGMRRGSEYKPEVTVDLDKTKNYIITKHDKKYFESTGKEMMDIFELRGKENALLFLEKKKTDRTISAIQYRKLKNIIIALANNYTEIIENKNINKEVEIDAEILIAMKNKNRY